MSQSQQRVSLMRYKAKELIKAPFAALGVDIRRKRPELDELQFLSKLKIRTVLDIGANRGQFATEIRPITPDAVLHCFEPVEEAFAALKCLASSDRRLFAHNLALGEEDGETYIEVNQFTPSSSLLAMAPLHVQTWPHTAGTKRRRVQIMTLDSWASGVSLEEPILIKIDVQGYEDRVIRGGRKTMERTRVVVTEVSFHELYHGQVLFDDFYPMLRSHGFRCMGMFGNLGSTASGILQSNAIFLRP